MRENKLYLVRLANCDKTQVFVRAFNFHEAESKALQHCNTNAPSVLDSDGSLSNRYKSPDKIPYVTFIERLLSDLVL